MLQRIRQHKTFAAVVIAVFALLLLAAALSGAPVRAASPAVPRPVVQVASAG
jgi:hypothetical protein